MDYFYKFIKEMPILFEVTRAGFRKCGTCDLTDCNITTLPAFLIANSSIQKLLLDRNQISKIPEGIVALNCLSYLRLDSNKLSAFPQVVCQLTKLMSLYLSCNNIRFLPSEIENLKKLEFLFMNNTGLEYIPEQIGGCKSLVGIVARKNCIQRLPESFGLLDQLEWLNLEENKITELPQSFGALTKLRHLNLRKNRLSSFPDVVNDIRTIQCCLLEDNCIETITPRQIELSAFMEVLGITNNPAASSEELVSIFPNFTHVVYNKLDGDLDHYGRNELDSNTMDLILLLLGFPPLGERIELDDIQQDDIQQDDIQQDDIPHPIVKAARYIAKVARYIFINFS